VSYRRWILVTVHLVVLFHFSLATVFAQQEPATADQVITKYMAAIGTDRFSSITTFAERGELYGNLTNFWQGSRAPGQSAGKEHGTFEFYFKAPNLRFSSRLTGDNRVISLHGCDGRVSWYIDSRLERREFKPKPGSQYDCETGFEPMTAHLGQANVKMQLKKKKAVEGRMAWEIKVDDPKSQESETYYFDAETYFLLRIEARGSKVIYSDYRDVRGIKLPFTTTNEFGNSKVVTTVRELKVNAPIDEARFVALQSKGGAVAMNPVLSPNKNNKGDDDSSKASNPPSAETSSVSPEIPATPNAVRVTEVNFPNFTSCTIAELQQIVPQLNGLKPARDQEKLAGLLDKVGTKTLEIAQHTPNLISREVVTDLQQGVAPTSRDYDYLILTRPEGHVVTLNEFRVDLKSGDKFETFEGTKNDSSTLAEVERTSRELAKSPSGRPPASQGFASSWVDFYPFNRPQATFRYLGEQKMDRQHTLVVAFAQKPQSVVSPALFHGQDKAVPMFLQGIAWIDASDFRIVRLRTDLLEPIPEVSLHRLTAEVQFVPTRIEGLALMLSLPREVMITSEIGRGILREDHLYSEYRLFRAKSKIVLNP
jgi:hypothetical protein